MSKEDHIASAAAEPPDSQGNNIAEVPVSRMPVADAAEPAQATGERGEQPGTTSRELDEDGWGDLWPDVDERAEYEKGQELSRRSQQQAEQLGITFPLLAVLSELGYLIFGAHRCVAGGPAWPTPIEPELGHQLTAAIHGHYTRIHNEVREMSRLMLAPRRGLVRVVSGDQIGDLREVHVGLSQLLFHPPLAEPRSHLSVLLLDYVDLFSRYLLLVTNSGPVFWNEDGKPTWQRAFMEDVLRLTGLYTEEAEVNRACKAAADKLRGRHAASAGLRLSREERMEAKAWHAKHNFA